MRPRSASRSTRTCYGMPAAMRWPTRHRSPHTAGLSWPSLDLFDHALSRAGAGRVCRLWHFGLAA
jgi:hypothetical protein